ALVRRSVEGSAARAVLHDRVHPRSFLALYSSGNRTLWRRADRAEGIDLDHAGWHAARTGPPRRRADELRRQHPPADRWRREELPRIRAGLGGHPARLRQRKQVAAG